MKALLLLAGWNDSNGIYRYLFSGFWKVQNWIVFFSRSLKRSKSRKGILESLISKVILIRSSLVLSALINSSSKSLGPVQTTIMSSINLLYSWRYWEYWFTIFFSWRSIKALAAVTAKGVPIAIPKVWWNISLLNSEVRKLFSNTILASWIKSGVSGTLFSLSKSQVQWSLS